MKKLSFKILLILSLILIPTFLTVGLSKVAPNVPVFKMEEAQAGFAPFRVLIGAAGLVGGDKTSYDGDGTGDWLAVDDDASFTLGTSDWTIEMFVFYPATGEFGYLSGHGNGTGNSDVKKNDSDVLSIHFEQADATVIADYSDNSAWTSFTGAWHHLAFQRRDGASPEGEIYVDGVARTLTENTAWGSNSIDDMAADWLIMNRNVASTNEARVKIDEFRLSNVARYTGNFTPTEVEFVSDANTLILIHCGETITSGTTGSGAQFTESGTNSLNVTEVGNTVRDTDEFKL